MDNRAVQQKKDQQSGDAGENHMPMLAGSAASRLVRDILSRLNSPYAEAAARPMRPGLLWRQVAMRLGLLQEQSSSPGGSFLPAQDSGVPRPQFVWRARPARRPLVEENEWAEEPMITFGPQVEPGAALSAPVARPAPVPLQSSPALALPAPPTPVVAPPSLPSDVTSPYTSQTAAQLSSPPPVLGPASSPPDAMLRDVPAVPVEASPALPETAVPNTASAPPVSSGTSAQVSVPQQATEIAGPAPLVSRNEPPTPAPAGLGRSSYVAQLAGQLFVGPPGPEAQPAQPQLEPVQAAPAQVSSALADSGVPGAPGAASVPTPASEAPRPTADSGSEPPHFVPARVVRVTYTQRPAVGRPAPLAIPDAPVSKAGIAASLSARLYGAEPTPATSRASQTTAAPEFTYARSSSQRRGHAVTPEDVEMAEVTGESVVSRVAFTRRPIIDPDNPLVPTADLLARMEYTGVLEAARAGENAAVRSTEQAARNREHEQTRPIEPVAAQPSPIAHAVIPAPTVDVPAPLAMPLATPVARQAANATDMQAAPQGVEAQRGPVARLLDRVLTALPLPEILRRNPGPAVQESPAVAQAPDMYSIAEQRDVPDDISPARDLLEAPIAEPAILPDRAVESGRTETTSLNPVASAYQPDVTPEAAGIQQAVTPGTDTPERVQVVYPLPYAQSEHADSLPYVSPGRASARPTSPAAMPEAAELDASEPVVSISNPAFLAPPSTVEIELASDFTQTAASPAVGQTAAASSAETIGTTVPSAPITAAPIETVGSVAEASPQPEAPGIGSSTPVATGRPTIDAPMGAPGGARSTPGFVAAIISRLLGATGTSPEAANSRPQPIAMPWTRTRRQQQTGSAEEAYYEEGAGDGAAPQPQPSTYRAETEPTIPPSMVASGYMSQAAAAASLLPDQVPLPVPQQPAQLSPVAAEAAVEPEQLHEVASQSPTLPVVDPVLFSPPTRADSLPSEPVTVAGEPGISEPAALYVAAPQPETVTAPTELTLEIPGEALSAAHAEQSADVATAQPVYTTHATSDAPSPYDMEEAATTEDGSSAWSSLPEVAQEVSRAHVPLRGFSPLTTVLRSGGLMGRAFAGRSDLAAVQSSDAMTFSGPQASTTLQAGSAPSSDQATTSGMRTVQASVSPAERGTSVQGANSSLQVPNSPLSMTALPQRNGAGMIGQSSRSAGVGLSTSAAGTPFVPAAMRPSVVLRTPRQMSSTLAPYADEASSPDMLMDSGEVESLLHSLYTPDPSGIEMPLAIPYSGFATAPDDVAYPQESTFHENFAGYDVGYEPDTSGVSTDAGQENEGESIPLFGPRAGWATAPAARGPAATITNYSWGPSTDDGWASEASAWADVVASAVDSGPGISAPSYAPALALAADERSGSSSSQSSQSSGGGANGGGNGEQEQQKTAEGSRPGPDPAELDELADTVYDIIRRRITVERERHFA